MTFITVFGGANQIGGNKILVEDRDTRVFFDFGEPFGMKDEFFVEYLTPRDRFGLRDYFHFDLLPKIPGLYDPEWLDGTDVKASKPAFDAFFISHMHYDHASHLKFAHSGIPVYLGAAAEAIRRSWVATGGSKTDFGEHDFNTFRTGHKVKVGSVEVEPTHVDHSTAGAYGFLVHTSDLCIAYTGDLRLHGPRSDMTKEFVRKAASERPDVLICEGTRVADDDKREDLSEKGVEDRAKNLVSQHDKLAVVSFYPRDVDRMRTFRDVAKATKRQFVVSAKVAYLLESLRGDKHISVPDPVKDPNMLVYVRSMSRPFEYEKKYLDMLTSSDHVVDSAYVRKHQRELIFHCDFFQLTELIDVLPSPGSLFIRSQSEPFEEDDAHEEILMNWVKYFKLDFHQAHASGHANMQEIFSIVKDIGPKCVVPVHTEHADMFSRCHAKVRCPEARKRVDLR